MTATLEPVIEALRNELQQYGEMLALLEAQQQAVSQRESGSVLTSVPAIEAQSSVIQDARRTRETHQRQLAWALGRPENVTFHELLPLLPDKYRPLISALVQEINELLGRVRQFAEQNHSQLRRSLELMDRFLVTFSGPGEAVQLSPHRDSPEAGSAPRSISAAVV
jgi:flagellar biosynthesis/type III secretory pathway chaperone